MGTFEWYAGDKIGETPIYTLLFRGSNGELSAISVPTIAGAGEADSAAAGPPIIGGQPRYASYWRTYTVEVPAGARVFAPPEVSSVEEQLKAIGFPVVGDYGAAVAQAIKDDPGSITPYVGRVALNPGCLTDPNLFEAPGTPADAMTHCRWLDSQVAIDTMVDPSAIRASDVTLTCPFVSYRGNNIPPLK
jgi:hypothetical protein